MADADAFLIRPSDMTTFEQTPGASVRFVYGDDHGIGSVSIAISDNPPGAPNGFVHRHPIAEVFVVYEGRGIYTVGETEVVAEAGDVVVVPPNTWHCFRPVGDGPLRHVAAYDGGQVEIELQRADP
jgi:mannose-6-phosphate isomerase-like protein (cupin superfamily)